LTSNFKDLYEKAEKAIYTKGPAFMNVLAPCPRGWRYNTPDLMEILKLATDTCIWPLYEVENGVWKLNYKPKKKLPVIEYYLPMRINILLMIFKKISTKDGKNY